MAGLQIYPEVLRSLDVNTLTGAYIAIGGPLLHPASLVRFTNNSATLVTISWDGVHDHDILAGNSFVLYDIQANHSMYNQLAIREGTQFYLKGTSGIAGTFVYLTVLYVIEG